MTVTDRHRFTQCFNRLAVALRLPADEGDAAMKQVYYEALISQPIDAIEDAARELARNAQWFPKTSEWLDVAEKARSTRALTDCLPSPRAEPWHHECGTCDDTGWETLQCDGGSTCGRPREHAAHSYVVPCGCRGTNRTYQRKLEEQRQRARRHSKAVSE